MSVDASPVGAAADPAATVARYREAVERQDVDALIATLSPDVEMFSPISQRALLRGRPTIRDVVAAVFANVEEMQVVDEIATADGRRRVLYLRGHLRGGQPVEESAWLRFDNAGLVAELTLFIRPLSALTALVAAMGPPLAARRGRLRVWVTVALTRPIAFITGRGEPLALHLTGVQRR